MDALSILALGVAQAGGGGGGGTSDYSDLSNKPQINNVTLSGNKSLSDLGIPSYTAGDNITINNNEISVNGLALEKEDSFVQDGVDKVEVSGERVFLSQEVNGHYTKGLSLNPSGAINGDDQTASKLFGLTPSRLWFEDYNLDRTVRLAPNANYNGLTVNGNPIAMQSDIPAQELPTISTGDAGKVLTVNSGETGVEWATGGGGSSSGAVRYDEAQTLSNAEFNQVMSNLQLGASKVMEPKVVTGNFVSTPATSGQITTSSVNTWVYFDDMYQSELPATSADKYMMVITIDDVDYECEGYINNPQSNPYWYPNSGTTFEIPNIGTINYAAMVPAAKYVMLQFAANPTNNAQISAMSVHSKEDFLHVTPISSDVLPAQALKVLDKSIVSNNIVSASGTPSVVISTDSEQTSARYSNVALGFAQVKNDYDVAVGSSVVANGSNGAIAIGHQSAAYGYYSMAIGHSTYTKGSNDSDSGFMDRYKRIAIGENVYLPYDYCTLIGQNNEDRTKISYAKFSPNNTYAQGAVVWNGGYIFESLVSDNRGHYPTSGQDNEYWKVRWDLMKTFIIADGVNNSRHDAVTFYADKRAVFDETIIATNIPACPSADGVYNLQVSIVSGVPTYSWVAV